MGLFDRQLPPEAAKSPARADRNGWRGGALRAYWAELRGSCRMRKMRLMLLALSPLLIWGPPPLQSAMSLLYLGHLSAWFYGVFAPNSALFGPIFARGEGSEKRVALTFDDGPSAPHSPMVLEVLKQYGVQATFFVVGKMAEVHPDLMRRIREEGHLIGNHTYHHPPHMAFEGLFGRRRIVEEIERGEAALEAIVGERPNLFRPPQGFKNPLILEVCRRKGIIPVGYTLRPPYHARGHRPSAVAERLLRKVQPGSIINFHDGWRGGRAWDSAEMATALLRLIEGLRAKGYRFVTLQEMMRRREGPR